MNKLPLDNRENINLLVRRFYQKVQKDDMLSEIFDNQISDWEAHYARLTDFWETNLLFLPRYKGNPTKIHNKVDEANNYNITQAHFGRWLQLWFNTLNNGFIGKNADLAKNRARLMSTQFFLKMFNNRKSIDNTS